jgi:hypothetical protein
VNSKMMMNWEFVEYIPAELDDNTVYISLTYATAAHKCCCGCGNRVVTPFSPTDWKLIFDGETISIDPSIGNWNFPCRSHYWISRSKVRWARPWSKEKIQSGRERDRAVKELHFNGQLSANHIEQQEIDEFRDKPKPRKTRKKQAIL